MKHIVQFLLAFVISFQFLVTGSAKASASEIDIDLMKFIEQTNDSLGSNLMMNNQADAIEDSEMLRELLLMVEEHFEVNSLNNQALKISNQAVFISNDLRASLYMNDVEKAKKIHVSLSENCQACHKIFE
ncbi:hypothetical protein [Catenovulum sediminis]|uniref:hypothetical protein n=1 Tax=Catenovulum sediminis TaxID=1740262 RepID=UPI0011808180|nr:hypothetical protein [Catenovulum sediminis]